MATDPFRWSCTLCGVPIPHNSKESMNEFRGLIHRESGGDWCATDGEDGSVCLTEVGFRINHDDVYEVPVAPSMVDTIGPTFSLLQQAKSDRTSGLHVFVFHAPCWTILNKVFGPQEIPLERLWEVCNSIPQPFHTMALDWGHGYGLAINLKNQCSFPWEEVVSNNEVKLGRGFADLTRNPYVVPRIKELMSEKAKELPQNSNQSTAAPSPRTMTPSCDIFNKLSLELCSAIAMYLPTADFFNARLASRSFWPVFHSQQYWSTRFRDGFERSWVFEAKRTGVRQDWRWLHRRTATAPRNKLLRNRERVWKLAEKVYDLVHLRWNQAPEVAAPILRRGEVMRQMSAVLWEPLEYSPSEFMKGYRLSYSQHISIPSDLTHFSVYTVNVGDKNYVCGMKFTPALNKSIRLGYQSTNVHSIEVSQSITGFSLVIGSRGIHAVQCGFEGGEVGPWLGSLEDAPQTQRFVLPCPITTIKAGFDACKMVSLALSQPFIPRCNQVNDTRLRNWALWYPDLPPPTLSLNSAQFPQAHSYIKGFNPLFWISFGGPNGIHLQHLTGITAFTQHGINRIRFHYSMPISSDQLNWLDLGRRTAPAHIVENITEFDIDGPGGERLIKIVIYEATRLMHHSGQTVKGKTLCGLELHTNYGRSGILLENETPLSRHDITTISIIPNDEVITGFYASQESNSDIGLATLGIISEPIKD